MGTGSYMFRSHLAARHFGELNFAGILSHSPCALAIAVFFLASSFFAGDIQRKKKRLKTRV